MTHHHVLLGFTATDWRHFGAILQSVHRRCIDQGWKGGEGEKGKKEEIQGLHSDVISSYQKPVLYVYMDHRAYVCFHVFVVVVFIIFNVYKYLFVE